MKEMLLFSKSIMPLQKKTIDFVSLKKKEVY